MTQLINELQPAKLNSTKLAIDDLGLGLGIARTLYGHSGNRFNTQHLVTGADPVISFRTPFKPAFDLIGFSRLVLTGFEIWMAKFVDLIKDPTAAHWKAAGTAGMAVITGWSVNQRGILMAEVAIVPFSASTGMADPMTITTNNDLANIALSAEPELHTHGPSLVNGTRLSGTKSSGGNLNHTYLADPSDGEKYARTGDLMGGDPELIAEHEDPRTLLATLGFLGAALSSNAIWYYRGFSGGVVGSTGLSITCASGRAMPTDMSARHRARARQGLIVEGLSSSDGTHPFAVASGVAVPD